MPGEIFPSCFPICPNEDKAFQTHERARNRNERPQLMRWGEALSIARRSREYDFSWRETLPHPLSSVDSKAPVPMSPRTCRFPENEHFALGGPCFLPRERSHQMHRGLGECSLCRMKIPLPTCPPWLGGEANRLDGAVRALVLTESACKRQ